MIILVKRVTMNNFHVQKAKTETPVLLVYVSKTITVQVSMSKKVVFFLHEKLFYVIKVSK